MEADAIRCQFVVFANFCNKVEDFSSRLKAYLDLKGYTGDVMMHLHQSNEKIGAVACIAFC
jgi:hypothetical protein